MIHAAINAQRSNRSKISYTDSKIRLACNAYQVRPTKSLNGTFILVCRKQTEASPGGGGGMYSPTSQKKLFYIKNYKQIKFKKFV